MRRHSKGMELARKLRLPESRGIEAVLKAELIAAVAREAKVQKLTHAELARRSKLPRSAVTGILSGSLQRVTLDRILKLVEAVGFVPEIKLKKVA
jgi:predicted transcriptional regulator